MFQLRWAHFEAFDRAVRREWHWHLADTMRQVFPVETEALDDDALLTRVEKADSAALLYNITSRAGIMRFVGIGFLAGESYYTAEPIQCGLRHPDMDPEYFIEKLAERLPDSIRQATKTSSTPPSQPAPSVTDGA